MFAAFLKVNCFTTTDCKSRVLLFTRRQSPSFKTSSFFHRHGSVIFCRVEVLWLAPL